MKIPIVSRPIPSFRQDGFTVVELLVVITVIAVLTGLATIGFRTTRGANAKDATDLLAATMLNARALAVSSGYGARFIIDNSYREDAPDFYLRRYALLRGVQTESGTQWELVNRAQLLPRGIFLLKDYCKGLADMAFDFGKAGPQTGTDGTNVLFLEFSDSGILKTGTNSDARIVVGPATVNGSGNLEFRENMLLSRSGFLLRQIGQPVFFQNVDQIVPFP